MRENAFVILYRSLKTREMLLQLPELSQSITKRIFLANYCKIGCFVPDEFLEKKQNAS